MSRFPICDSKNALSTECFPKELFCLEKMFPQFNTFLLNKKLLWVDCPTVEGFCGLISSFMLFYNLVFLYILFCSVFEGDCWHFSLSQWNLFIFIPPIPIPQNGIHIEKCEDKNNKKNEKTSWFYYRFCLTAPNSSYCSLYLFSRFQHTLKSFIYSYILILYISCMIFPENLTIRIHIYLNYIFKDIQFIFYSIANEKKWNKMKKMKQKS